MVTGEDQDGVQVCLLHRCWFVYCILMLLCDRSFDPVAWPDPAAMTKELRSHGVETMTSVWPSVEKASQNYKALKLGGLLARTETGVPFVVSDQGAQNQPDAYEYDPFLPEGRSFLAEQIQQNYIEKGVTSFWLDASEGVAMGEVHSML